LTALGATIPEARTRAYDATERISWPGLQLRHDIAAVAASYHEAPSGSAPELGGAGT
jgi:phosphoribosylamine-glycine ligase